MDRVIKQDESKGYKSDGYESDGYSSHDDCIARNPVTSLEEGYRTTVGEGSTSGVRLALLLKKIREQILDGKPYADLFEQLLNCCGGNQFMTVGHTDLPNPEEWQKALTSEEFIRLKKVVLNCLSTFLAICEINRRPVLQDSDNYRLIVELFKKFFACFDLACADTADEFLRLLFNIDQVQLIGFIKPDWLVPLLKSAGIEAELRDLVDPAIKHLQVPAGQICDFKLYVLNLIEYAKLTGLEAPLTAWIEKFIDRSIKSYHVNPTTKENLCKFFKSYIVLAFRLPKLFDAIVSYVHGFAATEADRWGDGGWNLGCGEDKATCAWHTAKFIATVVDKIGSIGEERFEAFHELYKQLCGQYDTVCETYKTLHDRSRAGAEKLYKGVVESSKKALVNSIEWMIEFVFHNVIGRRNHFSRLILELNETTIMDLISSDAQDMLTALQDGVSEVSSP